MAFGKARMSPSYDIPAKFADRLLQEFHSSGQECFWVTAAESVAPLLQRLSEVGRDPRGRTELSLSAEEKPQPEKAAAVKGSKEITPQTTPKPTGSVGCQLLLETGVNTS